MSRWISVAIYLEVAIAALVIGIAINHFVFGFPLGGEIDPLTSLFALVVIYAALHLTALAVVGVLTVFLLPLPRSICYLALSLIGLIGSTIALYVYDRTEGVHLAIIYWVSLVVIASIHFWRVGAGPTTPVPSGGTRPLSGAR